MPAYFGEIFTLRPEGFQLDIQAIGAFIQRVLGAYRRREGGQWNIVVPASDLQRWIDDPTPKTSATSGPQYATIHIDDDNVWIHPGYSTSTWGCTQRVITWLLGFGPWRIQGLIEDYSDDIGVIYTEQELFPDRCYDPAKPFQVPDDLTTSPPVVGELTTLSRFLGKKDKADYMRTFVRVHDSGAFSCDHELDSGHVRWEGRLVAEFISQWKLLVQALNFDEMSTTVTDEESDPVGVEVEQADDKSLFRAVDAKNPQPSFAPLVRLMDSWYGSSWQPDTR